MSDEEIEATFPPHGRVDDIIPADRDIPPERLDAMKTLDDDQLKELGLQPFDEEHTLWLLPGEWFDQLPEGYPMKDILGETEPFDPSESNDTRFGALPYGIEVDR